MVCKDNELKTFIAGETRNNPGCSGGCLYAARSMEGRRVTLCHGRALVIAHRVGVYAMRALAECVDIIEAGDSPGEGWQLRKDVALEAPEHPKARESSVKLLVEGNAVKHGGTTAKAASDATGHSCAAEGATKGKTPICHAPLGEPVRERVATGRVTTARERVQERKEGERTPDGRRAREADCKVRCCPKEVEDLSRLTRHARTWLR
mmetsp:Transcript_21896/g.65651  ORF Transcript_21896/g.65651 Transcript_21896/m.65651 type:complete len:207 (+) Transcript_21896:618-1238(+)